MATTMATKIEYALELVRSAMGDGGWSLHAHRTDVTDDSIAEYPLLVSGESEADEQGEWVRPLPADYEAAQARAAHLAEDYPLEVA